MEAMDTNEQPSVANLSASVSENLNPSVSEEAVLMKTAELGEKFPSYVTFLIDYLLDNIIKSDIGLFPTASGSSSNVTPNEHFLRAKFFLKHAQYELAEYSLQKAMAVKPVHPSISSMFVKVKLMIKLQKYNKNMVKYMFAFIAYIDEKEKERRMFPNTSSGQYCKLIIHKSSSLETQMKKWLDERNDFELKKLLTLDLEKEDENQNFKKIHKEECKKFLVFNYYTHFRKRVYLEHTLEEMIRQLLQRMLNGKVITTDKRKLKLVMKNYLFIILTCDNMTHRCKRLIDSFFECVSMFVECDVYLGHTLKLIQAAFQNGEH